MSNWLQSVALDCRYGFRQRRKNPGFTAVAVATLAFAIGAYAAVFSVISALLLYPLNLPQEESLYAVWRANATSEESYPDYLELRDRNRSFDGLAAYSVAQAGLDAGGNPSLAWVEEVSGNYFDVLHPLAVSSTALMSMALIVLHMSCSRKIGSNACNEPSRGGMERSSFYFAQYQ